MIDAIHGRSATPLPGALLGALVAATLAGCSGDDRAFLEAVEVRELSLADLSVAPPSRAPLPLTLSPGDSLDLDLLALDAERGELDIEVVDREWSVADAAIGDIDRNGRFTGRGEGSTDVDLEIGGFAAAPLNVTVRRATLEVDPEVEGTLAPDRCVATEYYAVGTFDDGSERLLTDARFSVADGSGARLRDAEDGADGVRRLVPTRAGPLTLSVTAQGRTADVELDVADTLQGITVASSSSGFAAGNEGNLTATGTFLDAQGAERTVDVTDTVDFELGLPDTQFGQISNLDDGTRGTFTASGQGNVTVNVRCGEDTVAEPFPIAIGAAPAGTATGGNTGGLSFDVGNSITLSLARDQLNGQSVRVSSERGGTGATGRISVISSNQNVVQVTGRSNGVQTTGGPGNTGLGNNGLDNGLGNNGLGNNNGFGNGGSVTTETVTLVPVGLGQAIVSASENGRRVELTVDVEQ